MADKYVVIAGDEVVERIDALNYLHAVELQQHVEGDLYIVCGGHTTQEAIDDYIARGGAKP